MSAYYIERNNMSGNGGMDQSQNTGGQGQRMNPGTPGAPGGTPNGMQGNGMQGSTPGMSNGMQGNGMSGGQGMNGGMGSNMGSMPGQGANANAANGSGTVQRDYRDDLRELLDRAHSERGLTRYRLCKQMGIDSGTLSNVLAKRRHFSLEKLEQILALLGYRLTFAPAPGGPKEMLA